MMHAAARGRRHDGLDGLHGQGKVRLAFQVAQESFKVVTRDDSDTISGIELNYDSLASKLILEPIDPIVIYSFFFVRLTVNGQRPCPCDTT